MAEPPKNTEMAELHKKPYKIFNDPIHGSIELHPYLVGIIDTPEFQRLRHIKQMGSVYFVYPGASHCRFEHSIGVAHLAGELVKALNEQYRRHPDENLKEKASLKDGDPLITDDEGLCVQIAALCHDLGHGPFSHLFDERFLKKVLEKYKGTKKEAELKKGGKIDAEDGKWKHENQSKFMLEKLVKSMKDGDCKKFIEKHQDFIQKMIDPPKKKSVQLRTTEKKTFLYEIVSNKRNGIDVDKMDYFARDCHYLGIENNFNCRRFFKFARVCVCNDEMQICMRDKEVRHMYDLYHTRNNIHQKACQHKVVGAIDTMIVDALFFADETLKISDTAFKADVSAYTELTDEIYQKILFWKDPDLKNPSMKKAQEILERISSRDLYKCVHQIYVKGPVTEPITQKDLAEKLSLKKEEIELRMVKMTYGMEGEDPIKNIKFYTKDNPCEARNLEREEISQLLPNIFSEQVLQVFCKPPKTRDEIIALQKEAKKLLGPHPKKTDPVTE